MNERGVVGRYGPIGLAAVLALPSLLAGIGSAALYGALGLGTRGTAHVDPLAEPLHSARARAREMAAIHLGLAPVLPPVASVLALTPDGRPALVAFRFSVPLDDPSLRWFEWRDGRYAPFAVPAVGRARHLPAAWPLGLGGRR